MATTPPPMNHATSCGDPRAAGFETPSVHLGVVRDIHSRWATDTPLTVDELCGEFLCDLGTSKVSGGTLTFVSTPNHPKGLAQVLHNVRECCGPGPHRKSAFCCVGNVHEHDIDVIKFNKDILEVALSLSVHKDIAAHVTKLGAVQPGNQKVVGPCDHTADPATCEEQSTRKSMFLPATLVCHRGQQHDGWQDPQSSCGGHAGPEP